MEEHKCVYCGSELTLFKTENEIADGSIILRNNVWQCSSGKCGKLTNLARDNPYQLHWAAAKEFYNKPLTLLFEEVYYVFGFLCIHAGHDEDLANFLGFNNFNFLKQNNLDSRWLYRDMDKDSKMMLFPFVREVRDLVTNQFGYPHFEDLYNNCKDLSFVSDRMDATTRMLLEKVKPIAYPVTLGEVHKSSEYYLINVCY